MALRTVDEELQIIKEDLHYYNFIKSIVRLFSVRLREDLAVIGPYQILDTCGTGGNGIVYRVRHREDHHQYALKIPYLSYPVIEWFQLSRAHMYDDPFEKIDEIAEAVSSARFTAEVRPRALRTVFSNAGESRAYQREYLSMKAAAGRSHLVSLHDYGVLDLIISKKGEPDQKRELAYLVMPFFEGVPLSRFFDRDMAEPLRWQTAIHLLDGAIDLVDQVHQCGVIHRDLHPGNFIYEERSGDLSLIDFGSALPRSGQPVDTEGEKRGSKRFMAPEQFADPRKADTRSDYFCIGGLLFFMLTRQSPFRRNRKRHTRPLPPETCVRKPDIIDKKVYHNLIMFMNRLMCFQREKRYQTMEEIRKDWNALLSGLERSVYYGEK